MAGCKARIAGIGDFDEGAFCITPSGPFPAAKLSAQAREAFVSPFARRRGRANGSGGAPAGMFGDEEMGGESRKGPGSLILPPDQPLDTISCLAPTLRSGPGLAGI